mmetsp:Transcript_7323/g.21637  ORF Transcript_7323/g.21637 Transcript_7323/m.21637 type:complete len:515 (-) Transcript_7323:99-1643(-)|eukprot:CAMPEP_0182926576 /NCGR_PEP_ID=MMETSP0105_2-20130417/12153_1 /TAXON_ID=81532 ORGANISM="Acanthoeca-like sp., Strain 10tr" /NCGR_SAMPLE_ID=MMETSP0105_2 /ASSEMBLY_ACC=CAM_ASM_000205 /LENGTH=514 /DNA_ID=CAMNT_0025064475 /DNA_START=218 /DNA_END=1762 /DNA_ORIENTATION=+
MAVGESTMGIGPVVCAIVAIFLLCLVLSEKLQMLDALYPVKKHPARLAFINICVVEIAALALFVAGMYQVDHTEDCRTAGLLMHFFLLASVIWISFLVVDMALRSKLVTAPPFGSTEQERDAAAHRSSVVLACIAWGVPAICVITQTVPSGKCWDASRYGGKDFCWISSDHTLNLSYYLPAALAAAIGIMVWLRWFLELSVAADKHVMSPKLVARVTTDMHGAIVAFFPGIAAYFAVASISTTRAEDSQPAQFIFCVGIVAHTLALAYYFVLVPANTPGEWTTSPRAPFSESGSLASIGMHSMGGQGMNGRMMAIPPSSAASSRRPSGVLSDSAAARRALAMAIKFSLSELTLFSRKLHEVAPTGSITYAQFLATWGKCFPDKIGNGQEYVDHIFKTFDRDGNGEIDHQELTLMLSATSFAGINDKVNAMFTLYDVNGDGALSQSELFQMTKRILNLEDDAMSTEWLRVRDISEMMHLEIDANGDGLISREEFINAASTPGGVLYDVLTGPMVN